MKKIGILSDTHAHWDDKYLHYFAECDEIWHAGDIGSLEVAEKLAAFKPFKAVCGNCDGGDIRLMYKEIYRRYIKQVKDCNKRYKYLILEKIIEEPAPSFYIEEETFRGIIYRTLRERNRNFALN